MSRPRQPDPADFPFFNNDPTPQKGMHVPILRPKVGGKLVLVAIADAVQGADLHHDGVKTIPCTRKKGKCVCCDQKIAWRRYWFLTVATLPALKLGILSITDGAYKECPFVQHPETPLRGHYITAWRTGAVMNGPMHVSVGKHCGSDALPADIDLRSQLLRIWGFQA